MRRTKIVATIGPASRDLETLTQMVAAGVDVVRLNFSHGTLEMHAENAELVRKAATNAGRQVAILQDLPGPKIRIGALRDDIAELKPGEELTLACGTNDVGDDRRISVSYAGLPAAVDAGDVIYLADGAIRLRVTNVDQDTIVSNLLTWAAWLVQSSSGAANFNTAGFLPIQSRAVDPSGNPRGASGQIRQRTYYGNATYLEQLDLLSKVAGGFDYDVQPEPEAGRAGFTAGFDAFRVFYPYQGSDRTAQLSFVYGSNVASVQRSFSSVDFANYVRELGNNLADINLQTTLNEHAQGDIGLTSLPAPTYTVGLTPDTYRWGNPAMGDVVPLIVQSGRLNINPTVRVLGITYTVGNDGQETVDLTVGRPQPNLRSAFHRITRDINALTRW